MEFKFNFDVGDESSEGLPSTKDTHCFESKKAKHNESTIKCYGVADIIKRWSVKDSADIYAIDKVKVPGGESSLYTITPSDPDANTTILANDLISSVYEGGFKIWECTEDLMKYLSESGDCKRIKGKTVIDIGCGVGLLGVYALKFCHADFVTFQDFNKNVILDATGPTALINTQSGRDGENSPTNGQDDHIANGETEVDAYMKNFNDCPKLAETASSKMDFIAGDWSELQNPLTNLVKHTQYDVVLSSETIYNEGNYDALHDYLKAVTKINSVILMSAKSHYFGVGGGVNSWIDFVKRKGVFTVDIVKDVEANLRRHILRLNRK